MEQRELWCKLRLLPLYDVAVAGVLLLMLLQLHVLHINWG